LEARSRSAGSGGAIRIVMTQHAIRRIRMYGIRESLPTSLHCDILYDRTRRSFFIILPNGFALVGILKSKDFIVKTVLPSYELRPTRIVRSDVYISSVVYR